MIEIISNLSLKLRQTTFNEWSVVKNYSVVDFKCDNITDNFVLGFANGVLVKERRVSRYFNLGKV